MRLNAVLYLAGIIIIMYLLRVSMIVALIDNAMDTWNFTVDYVLNFKDKQPVIFLLLPVALLLLMKGK